MISATGRSFLFSGRATLTCLLTFAASCGAGVSSHTQAPSPDGQLDYDGSITPDLGADASESAVAEPRINFVTVSSTAQLVSELYTGCTTGWTTLYQNAEVEGTGGDIPLSELWVTRFSTISEFGRDLAATYRTLGSLVPTTRFSVSQCMIENTDIAAEFVQLIAETQEAGYAIELNLSHHDSYPAALHDHPDFGMYGGWAHPDAKATFIAYLEAVLTTLDRRLKTGTVIYIGNEPVQELLSGYVESGAYPPGGTGAGLSLTQALVNLRDAYRQAAALIRDAGFTPAIAPNVRPLTSSLEDPGARTLEYVHNWWLTDALIDGCIDNDFDGTCEERITDGLPAVAIVGLTFYGTMYVNPVDETVALGLPGAEARPLARRRFDFTPSRDRFEETLTETLSRYAEKLAERQIVVGVGEIGFSHANTTIQSGHFQDYLEVALKHDVPFLGIHTIFQGAEFGQGEWNFHLVSRCAPCELTDWGEEFLDIVQVTNFPP